MKATERGGICPMCGLISFGDLSTHIQTDHKISDVDANTLSILKLKSGGYTDYPVGIKEPATQEQVDIVLAKALESKYEIHEAETLQDIIDSNHECWVCDTEIPTGNKYCQYHCEHPSNEFNDFIGKCGSCGKQLNVNIMLAEVKQDDYTDDIELDCPEYNSLNEVINSGSNQTCCICGKDFVLVNGQDGVFSQGLGTHDTDGNEILRNEGEQCLAHKKCLIQKGLIKESKASQYEKWINDEFEGADGFTVYSKKFIKNHKHNFPNSDSRHIYCKDPKCDAMMINESRASEFENNIGKKVSSSHGGWYGRSGEYIPADGYDKYFENTKEFGHDDLTDYHTKCKLCGINITQFDDYDHKELVDHIDQIHPDVKVSGESYANEDYDEDGYDKDNILSGRSVADYLKDYGISRADAKKVAKYADMDLKDLIQTGNFDEAHYHMKEDEHDAMSIYESYTKEATPYPDPVCNICDRVIFNSYGDDDFETISSHIVKHYNSVHPKSLDVLMNQLTQQQKLHFGESKSNEDYDNSGYDDDGYDKYGYDKYGWNRDGRDDDGYDIDGLNKDGYNRSGYDRDGRVQYGYNKYAYDRYGLDRDGKKKGESKSNEDSLVKIEDDGKKITQLDTWENQNIAERRTTINAYLRRKQNAWGEKYIDEKHTGMTHYVDYGFTDNEWNLFSEDTKNSLRRHLSKNNESLANEDYDEYGYNLDGYDRRGNKTSKR